MALRTLKGLWRWQNNLNVFSLKQGKKTALKISVVKFISTGNIREDQENILGTALRNRSSTTISTDVRDGLEDFKLALEEAENHLYEIGYYREIDKKYGNAAMLESLFKRQTEVILNCLHKLEGSKHPIVALAEDLYSFSGIGRSMLQGGSGEKSLAWLQIQGSMKLHMILSSLSLQIRAVMILLVSSIIHGINKDGYVLTELEVSRLDAELVPKRKNNINDNSHLQIKDKHRKLADIAEMIFAAYSIHETVVTLPKSPQNLPNYELLQHGNNLSALMGDLLLAKSSRALADLCNAEVTESMSNAIADFAESQFLIMAENGGRTGNISSKFSATNRFSKFSKGRTTTWIARHSLGLGSLLGNACGCNAIFSGADVALQEFAYKLGESLALIIQAAIEISQVQTGARISSHGSTPGNQLNHSPRLLNVEGFTLPLVEALDCNLISETDLRNIRLDSAEYNDLCHEMNNRNLGMIVFRHLQDDIVRTLSHIDGAAAGSLTRLIESLSPVSSD